MKRFWALTVLLCLTLSVSAQIEGVHFGNFGSESEFLLNAAKDFSDRNEFGKAVECYKMVDSICGLRERELIAYLRCYYLLGDYENAIMVGEKWTNQFEKHSLANDRFTVYGFLADVYMFSGDYHNAIEYYKRLISVDDRDRRALSWEKFMLGRAEFMIGETGEMKRNCTNAAMDLCLYFGVTVTDIWNDEVKSDEIGLIFYALAIMLYDTPKCKESADAAMTLALKCGSDDAAVYCKEHKVPCKPYKSKAFAKDKEKH